MKPSPGNPNFLGLRTAIYHVPDLDKGKVWYSKVLGIEPYFVRPVQGTPAYVEFRIGDYQHELGIIDSRFTPHGRPDKAAGAVIYWHVDDVRGACDRLISMRATVYEEPVERGPGFVTASVADPFGNILGVMYNQHYLEVLGS